VDGFARALKELREEIQQVVVCRQIHEVRDEGLALDLAPDAAVLARDFGVRSYSRANSARCPSAPTVMIAS